ncbi:MAG TPA: AI-2E family transporter, partial [Burkholderiales bacterium]|nr:AI-2E family transporter [Burkholderiales bacterium]
MNTLPNTPETESPNPIKDDTTPMLRALTIGVVILATVALIWLLDWAQVFFVSLLVGILIAYTLNPLVNGLERIKFPRVVATTIVMVSVLCALVFGAYSLRGQLQTIINQLPAASSKISKAVDRFVQSQRHLMDKVQRAARVFEKSPEQPKTATPPPATQALPIAPPKQQDPDVDTELDDDVDAKPAAAPIAPPAPTQPVQVVIEQHSSSKLGGYLWAGSVGAIGILGQVMMVIFLVH